jgi:adenylate kinase family enzyme
MKRICVLGCSGAGKTTLAAAIAARTGLPHHALDAHYWQSGWTPMAEDVWRRTHRRIIDADRWIIDGNYFGTLEARVAAADTVVFLDLPRWRCLLGILKRTALWWGRTRPDMGPGCPERLDMEFLRYVWRFKHVHRPIIVNTLSRLDKINVIRICDDVERQAFLETLRAPAKNKGRHSPA